MTPLPIFSHLLRHNCVKSVPIRSFFCSVFPWICTEYGDLQSKSTYSVQIQENTDQKKILYLDNFHAVYRSVILSLVFSKNAFYIKEILKCTGHIFKMKFPRFITANYRQWNTNIHKKIYYKISLILGSLLIAKTKSQELKETAKWCTYWIFLKVSLCFCASHCHFYP